MELDPHPEELLDLALKNGLLEVEQQVLDRHLAVCVACVAHLTLIRASQAAWIPQPWDSQSDRKTVDYVLDRVERSRWPVFSLRRRPWFALAGGLLLAFGGMASASWWHTRGPDQKAVHAPIPSASDIASVPHGAPVPHRLAKAQLEASLALQPEAPSVFQPEEQALSSSDGSEKKQTEKKQSAPRATRVPPSAALLFEQASALRTHNKPDEAISVFHRLQQLFPKSRESRISFAVAGGILLDRGRPVEALAQFDQHLAQRGEASEEALAGRAAALRRVGRLSDERETWERLLGAYPKSVYAHQAKERLSQLRRPQEALPGPGPSP